MIQVVSRAVLGRGLSLLGLVAQRLLRGLSRLQMLAVGETDVHQGNVLIAVAGVRVQLAVIQKRIVGHCELDGLLRAVLNAGETEFAVA